MISASGFQTPRSIRGRAVAPLRSVQTSYAWALSEQSGPGAAELYLGEVRLPTVAIQQAPHRGAA